MADLKVLGICGSLRKASFNMAALRACGEMMPEGMSLTIARIDDIPIFNQDVFDAGIPEAAKRLRAEVAAADGVLIASPEYNFSLTAALKNAIDWASRPPNQSWQDKPVAIFSVSAGPMGGGASSSNMVADRLPWRSRQSLHVRAAVASGNANTST